MPTGATVCSVNPPSPNRGIAITRRPSSDASTPSPSARTTPLTSAPGRERHRRLDLVLAAAHQHVGEVERCGGDVHHHLTGSGDRRVDVVEAQHRLRLPQLVHPPRSHRGQRTERAQCRSTSTTPRADRWVSSSSRRARAGCGAGPADLVLEPRERRQQAIQLGAFGRVELVGGGQHPVPPVGAQPLALVAERDEQPGAGAGGVDDVSTADLPREATRIPGVDPRAEQAVQHGAAQPRRGHARRGRRRARARGKVGPRRRSRGASRS